MGLNLTPAFQNGALNQDIMGAITLSNVDHPLAFSPTYFSPTLQSLADSPTVEVPVNPVTVLLPPQPLEVEYTINSELLAQKDLTHGENIDMGNENVNHSIPKKSSVSTMKYFGPYRSNPNFTRGRKLNIGTAKSSTPKVNIQTSFLNNQFVVAKRKITKRVDRSGGRGGEHGPKKRRKETKPS